MLVRLLPEQIPNHWDFIKESLDETFSYINDKQDYNEVLENLLIDRMTCWIIVEDDKIHKVKGIVITTFTKEESFNISGLLIFSFYLFESAGPETIQSSIRDIKKYGESLGCSEVYAFSHVKSVYKIAKTLGADVKTRRISFPIGG